MSDDKPKRKRLLTIADAVDALMEDPSVSTHLMTPSQMVMVEQVLKERKAKEATP